MGSAANKTTNKCSLVLACDVAALRDVIRGLLAPEPDFEIIAEVESLDELPDALRLGRPAILLCRFNPIDESVVSALLNVATWSARTRTVAFVQSEFERRQLLRKALVADALVLRGITIPRITSAIRNAWRGRWNDRVRGNGRATGGPELTQREQQVVSMLTQGFRPKEMAANLDISESAVHIYVDRLLEKYGAHRRIDPLLDSFSAYATHGGPDRFGDHPTTSSPWQK